MDSRRKNRRGKHGAWARAIISRDNATCRNCGARDVVLHAHHILRFAEHPDKRWDLDNGLTLCHSCHGAVHTASNANAKPSFGRKPVEGVTRGRAYRRWEGSCEWCQKFISKRWSDTVGKSHLFCSSACSMKFKWAHHPSFRVNGSKAPTSAPPDTE